MDELLLEEDCLIVFKQILMGKNNYNDDDDDLLKLCLSKTTLSSISHLSNIPKFV